MTDQWEAGDYHMLAIKLRSAGLHRNHVSKKLANTALAPEWRQRHVASRLLLDRREWRARPGLGRR